MARDRTVSSAGLDLQERVVEINRVAKVVKGGRRFSFTALVVVGDERDIVGIGYGKANEVPVAIQKGVEQAKKNLYRVPKHGSTITHQTTGDLRSRSRVLEAGLTGNRRDRRRRRPRCAGARRDPRHPVQVAGSQNPINLVKATMAGLQSLRTPDEVAEIRGLSVNQVLGLTTQEAEPVAAETLSNGTANGASEVARARGGRDRIP